MNRIPAVIAAVSLCAAATASAQSANQTLGAGAGADSGAAETLTVPQPVFDGTAVPPAEPAAPSTAGARSSTLEPVTVARADEEACGQPVVAGASGSTGVSLHGGSSTAADLSGLASLGEAPATADVPGTGATADFSRIEQVTCAAGELPEDQSAITAKVQVLLDRAGVSPGVIDGWKGGMTRTAIADLERREGLTVDGEMDPQVWEILSRHADAPITQSYTIAPEDTEVVGELPADYSEKAEYKRLGYQRVTERLAEKFHMDEEFLRTLNPGVAWEAGETITVMSPGEPVRASIQRVVIDKQRQRLYAMDGSGGFVTSYPVTIGSASTPSPSGTVEVTSVTKDPWYNYDPETFVQGDNYEKLSLAPGPNNPVGLVWIALNKPGYGIHGTPEPDSLFTAASHGCVRMTNWDALALADMVDKGTVVEFEE